MSSGSTGIADGFGFGLVEGFIEVDGVGFGFIKWAVVGFAFSGVVVGFDFGFPVGADIAIRFGAADGAICFFLIFAPEGGGGGGGGPVGIATKTSSSLFLGGGFCFIYSSSDSGF